MSARNMRSVVAPSDASPLPVSAARRAQVNELLRANHHPSTSRTKQIPELLAEARLNLVRFDEELDRLQLRIIALERQRAELQDHVAKYESLLAPIRKVPDDVLRVIFAHICDHDNPLRIYTEPRITHLPAFGLGLVCVHWRSISISTKDLWTNLWVTTVYYSLVDCRGARALLDTTLKRSGTLPLTVKIVDFRDGEQPDDWDFLVLDRLLSESHRWYDLTISADSGLLGESGKLVGKLSGRIPTLRHLTIALECELDVPLLFSDAPSLRTLDTQTVLRDLAGDAVGSDLPRQQITSLSTDAVNFAQLHTFTNLSTLTLIDYLADDEVDTAALPHWASTSVKTVYGVDFSDSKTNFPAILENSTLPSLTTLDLHVKQNKGENRPMFSLKAFSTFLERSDCTLTTLSLRGLQMPGTRFSTILAMVPELESFTYEPISGQHISDEFLLRLQRTLSQQTLLPKVRNICLESDEIKLNRVVDLIKSRWIPDLDSSSGHDGLKSVRLTVAKQELGPSDIKVMNLLAKGGMKLVVRDKTGVVVC